MENLITEPNVAQGTASRGTEVRTRFKNAENMKKKYFQKLYMNQNIKKNQEP